MRDEYAAVLPSASVLPFKLRPSREFAVRQAVLLAIHDHFPTTVEIGGLGTTARFLLETVGAYGDDAPFACSVRRNFREISARYDLQEIGGCL